MTVLLCLQESLNNARSQFTGCLLNKVIYKFNVQNILELLATLFLSDILKLYIIM